MASPNLRQDLPWARMCHRHQSRQTLFGYHRWLHLVEHQRRRKRNLIFCWELGWLGRDGVYPQWIGMEIQSWCFVDPVFWLAFSGSMIVFERWIQALFCIHAKLACFISFSRKLDVFMGSCTFLQVWLWNMSFLERVNVFTSGTAKKHERCVRWNSLKWSLTMSVSWSFFWSLQISHLDGWFTRKREFSF